MLYLAIDQHKAQLTINIRNEHGDVIQKGQVSTKHADIDDFFANFVKKARRHRRFMAIVEICGFNDWLLEKLEAAKCCEIVVIQPDDSSVQKTDRRDANALGELLWNNRKRLQGGQRPNGLKRIFPAKPVDAQIRQLSNFRQFLVTQRIKTINKIKGILNKHNMAQDGPTEIYRTTIFRKWIEKVQLPAVDRMEMDSHLELWKTYDAQILKMESELARRAEADPQMYKIKSIPGISAMGAITLLARIGDIHRFKSPDSLANYFGLTPGCRNSDKMARTGGITKAGSKMARNVLNFAVNHLVRKDRDMKAWHKKIKKRRGAKIARVAVMRKLATIIWHMLRWDKGYQFRYDPPTPVKKRDGRGPSKEVLGGMGNNHHEGKKTKTPLTKIGDFCFSFRCCNVLRGQSKPMNVRLNQPNFLQKFTKGLLDKGGYFREEMPVNQATWMRDAANGIAALDENRKLHRDYLPTNYDVDLLMNALRGGMVENWFLINNPIFEDIGGFSRIYAIDSIDGNIVVVGDKGRIAHGPNARALALVALPFGNEPVIDVKFGIDDFEREVCVAISQSNAVSVSRDGGKTWSECFHIEFDGVPVDFEGLCFGARKFLIHCSNGDVLTLHWDEDGNITATKQDSSPNITHGLYRIRWCVDKFISVGINGKIVTSINGSNWQLETSFTTVDLHDILHCNGVNVAVGVGGTVGTSPTGILWTKRDSRTTADLYAIWHSFGPTK